MTEKIMIAGSGGQGVLMLGLFLARVAAMEKRTRRGCRLTARKNAAGFRTAA